MKGSNYTEQVMQLRWKLNEAEIERDTAQAELSGSKQQLATALTRIQGLERLLMRYEDQRTPASAPLDKEGPNGIGGSEPRFA